MGTVKRERQKQGRQARIDAAHVAHQRSKRVKNIRNFGIVLVLIVGVVFVLSRGGDSKVATTASTSSSASAGSPVTINPPAAGASITADTPCPSADGASSRTTTFATAPPMCIDPAKTYTATIDTNKGSFTITLDAKAAPLTVNNFVVLARYHYYEGVAFHRIVKDFVIQGGDANGPILGEGSPGYSFADELPTATPPYEVGSVAMANSGANTNGSQFFVVTGAQGAALDAKYSKFGLVTAGMDVVQAIGQLATTNPQKAPPTTTDLVTINRVTITEA